MRTKREVCCLFTLMIAHLTKQFLMMSQCTSASMDLNLQGIVETKAESLIHGKLKGCSFFPRECLSKVHKNIKVERENSLSNPLSPLFFDEYITQVADVVGEWVYARERESL